jgi:DNA repair photolyase
LARKLEPRAAVPTRRLQTIQRLSSAGIPVTVLVSPLIPVLTDSEIEQVLEAARDAGASSARSVLLRLPLEVAPLFQQWLQTHYPNQSGRVLNRVRDTRGGELYRSDFSQRMTGTGEYAELLAKRFQLAIKKFGFGDPAELDCGQFRKPAKDDRQMSLL